MYSEHRGHGRLYRMGLVALAGPLIAALWSPVRAEASGQATPTVHPAFDYSYEDGVSGPVSAKHIDLAGTWNFQPVTNTVCTATGYTLGPQTGCVTTPLNQHTTIEVPGGGWVKQGYGSLSEAIYSRQITVPDLGGPQDTQIVFGAVNFQATLRIDGKAIGTNTTAFLPSSFDLTPFVQPGHTYTVSVDVKGRDALMDADGYYTVPDAADWSPNIAEGIYRSATLNAFPAVHISDAFVTTSVADKSLSYRVSIANASASPQTTTLTGRLSSWNGNPWHYPTLPVHKVTVPAHSTTVVTVGPVKWSLGPASYWWPDVPYRPNYRAQLHNLSLTLSTPDQAPGRAMYRFGFRQIDQVGQGFTLNGVPVNFRGDDLAGADYDSIDYGGGPSDAYDTYPGFLEPSSSNPGWPQVIQNYLRLNYNDVRIHQEAASPYMLDVADEMGLMVLDETAIRGSNVRQNFATGKANMLNDARDLVLRDRNHASVLRWSQANEPTSVKPVPGGGTFFDLALYQTIRALDPTRPISTDSYLSTDDLPVPDYTIWCHYYPQVPTTPPSPAIAAYTDNTCEGAPGTYPDKPFGQGEYIWSADSTKQGFAWFATSAEQMRLKGASDVRPYTLLDAWASVVPGVKTTDLTMEQGEHPMYGVNNLPNPWSNPGNSEDPEGLLAGAGGRRRLLGCQQAGRFQWGLAGCRSPATRGAAHDPVPRHLQRHFQRDDRQRWLDAARRLARRTSGSRRQAFCGHSPWIARIPHYSLRYPIQVPAPLPRSHRSKARDRHGLHR